jgi:hypothetical protein
VDGQVRGSHNFVSLGLGNVEAALGHGRSEERSLNKSGLNATDHLWFKFNYKSEGLFSISRDLVLKTLKDQIATILLKFSHFLLLLQLVVLHCPADVCTLVFGVEHVGAQVEYCFALLETLTLAIGVVALIFKLIGISHCKPFNEITDSINKPNIFQTLPKTLLRKVAEAD